MLAACSRPGDTGGTLTLERLDGSRLDLAEFRGKVVLIDAFATWCRPCREAIPGLANLSRSRSKELVVEGVEGAVDAFRIVHPHGGIAPIVEPQYLRGLPLK